MNQPIIVDSFELVECIGVGGMGRIYRACVVGAEQEVAVKVIAPEGSEKLGERFQREIEAHARLLDPGVVQLLDYGELNAMADQLWRRLGADRSAPTTSPD